MSPHVLRVTCVIATVAGLTMAAVGFQPDSQPKPPEHTNQPERPKRDGPGGPGGPGGAGRAQSVKGAMSGINRGLRQLRTQVTDASKKEDNLRIIGDMQRACLGAKELPPPRELMNAAKDDAAKTKVAETYRGELIKAMRVLIDLEQDVLDGKTDSAKTRLADLIKTRDAGHKAVGVEEEEHERRGPGGRGGEPGGERPDGDKK